MDEKMNRKIVEPKDQESGRSFYSDLGSNPEKKDQNISISTYCSGEESFQKEKKNPFPGKSRVINRDKVEYEYGET